MASAPSRRRRRCCPAAFPAPFPSCSYAFQWWLLPHDEGGAGPGLQPAVFILIPAITSILAFLMLGAMCVLAIPLIR